MSELEELQAAIEELTRVKAIGWPCDQWTQSAVRHVARNCEIECHNEDEHECEGWSRYETGPAISLLVRTIDAQLALLEFGVKRQKAVNWPSHLVPDKHVEAASLELALARAINGEVDE